MTKIFSLSVRWVKSDLDPNKIDAALTEIGDWLRFDAWSWLLASELPAHEISERIRSSLAPEDSLIVIRCDLSDYSGFAPKWMWDWIERHRLAPAGLQLDTPGRGGGLAMLSRARS